MGDLAILGIVFIAGYIIARFVFPKLGVKLG